MDEWHTFELRVRYQETDKMGVVYHANYLNWFEIGRTEMIRDRGLSYRQLEDKGLMLPVVDAEIKFLTPARYDDELSVLTRIEEFTPLRIRFVSEVRRKASPGQPEGEQGELLVSGTTRHVWLNRDWKPVRIDRAVPEIYAMLERKPG